MAQFSQPPGNQGGGFLQQLLAPEVAMPMAAALMGNQGNAANFGNAFGAYGQAQAQTAGKNKTLEYFRQNAPEFAAMVEAGMPVNEAWGTYTKQRYAQQADPYLSVGGKIFNKQDQSWISPPSDPNAPPETGLQPQMMRDPNTGETIYVQATKDGRLIRSQTPDGFQPYDPYAKAFETGRGTAAGKAEGEAAANLPTELATADQAITELDQLIAHPGLSAIAGPMDQYRPSWAMGAEGRDALARFNQAKGRAFLQAFGMLKGGGQITEIEGLKAEQAMARMDRAQGEAEFKQALQDFRDAVAAGREKLIQRAGGGGAAKSTQSAPQGGNRTRSGVSWSVGP